MKTRTQIFGWISIILFCGCFANDQADDEKKYSDPELALDTFFNACASMDSVLINELSMVEEYPLVTEWTIRRISDYSNLYMLSTINDTIQGLTTKLAQLTIIRQTYRDSLKFIIDDFAKLESATEAYTQAEIAWERAELRRIDNRLPSGDEETKRYKRKKDIRYNEYLAIKKYFDEDNPKEAERIQNILETNNSESYKYYKTEEYFQGLLQVVRKSTNTDNEIISICKIEGIADLKIPSKLGIMLNKKVRVLMLSADCETKNNKWIIMDIEYLGEDQE